MKISPPPSISSLTFKPAHFAFLPFHFDHTSSTYESLPCPSSTTVCPALPCAAHLAVWNKTRPRIEKREKLKRKKYERNRENAGKIRQAGNNFRAFFLFDQAAVISASLSCSLVGSSVQLMKTRHFAINRWNEWMLWNRRNWVLFAVDTLVMISLGCYVRIESTFMKL